MFDLITDSLWKYIALILATILVSISIYTFFLRIEVSSLREDNTVLNANIEKYNQATKQAEENQKTKIKYVDREVKVIEVQTQDKIKIVKEYIYDNNQTDCKNAISVLRASGF